MAAPNLYVADELRRWDCDSEIVKGYWVAARPMGMFGIAGLGIRIRLAWAVFTGRYDAVRWIGQED